MANRNPILLRPHWIINNIVTAPLVGFDNGRRSVRGLLQMALPITIFFDTLFNDAPGFTSRYVMEQKCRNNFVTTVVFRENRSFGNDRYPVYKSLEGILQTMGLDGKPCLLRTICEMQSNPISEFTVVGEIVTILLQ